ncbi:MAG: H+-transporting two-sector ATPase subunit gamma [Planctomycetaceae bacterium]|nr:H+-transporting two-sector ATPase subunit gamma [Planctomycetaceae bacterium]
MTETLESLRRQIDGADKLDGVVRAMKALAASSIGQFERAVAALGEYYRTVELGLVAAFRENGAALVAGENEPTDTIGAVIFGSDQGLVGQFNERLAEFASTQLAALPGKKTIWVVGERMQSRIADAGLQPAGLFTTPNSVAAIVPLIGQILTDVETQREAGKVSQFYLFHNRPLSEAAYEPTSQRVLPIDRQWYHDLSQTPWPTRSLPVLLNAYNNTLPALLREYLFVSLFKACAESLASENTSRLAAMRRAEKNIDEMLGTLNQSFHRLRQGSIDEELFDLVSGFEALPGESATV